ncbi:MAG: diguanylate cyclase [Phycisphaerales bacterium]|nr:MAG: diguanylate cyclase [Phycisphaerales bacterium]
MCDLRILLAEDDPGLGWSVRSVLRTGRRTIDLTVVSTPGQLLQLMNENSAQPFDCVMVALPSDEDTLELITGLMSDARVRPLLVILNNIDCVTVLGKVPRKCVHFLARREALCRNALWRYIDLALRESRREEDTRRRAVRRDANADIPCEHDSVTGLPTGPHLDRLFDGCRSTYDRRGHASVAVVDIDHLGCINDTTGHVAGDRVLREIVDTITGCRRPGDIACRYDGGGVVIVMPLTDHSGAVCRAEGLRTQITELAILSGSDRISATVSIGVATCRSEHLSTEYIRRADLAMQLAKRRGRDRVCTWEMVFFDDIVRQVSSDATVSPVEALHEVLLRAYSRLGTTQWDHLTSHAEYVSRMAVRTGDALGMASTDLERLRVAGLCHDLGKFLIPEHVLAKPAALSDEERQLVARHSADGAYMSGILGADEATAEFIRYHHVRFDNANRPGDAGGGPLPLGACILAVADALVTMTSYRPYCAERSFTGAVRELQRESGRQFDPDVVNAVPEALLAKAPATPS